MSKLNNTDHLYEEALAANLYFDKTFHIEAAKILPGEYYATTRQLLIVTVLGSCVSACIRDTRTGIGGMNHFMLPTSNDGGEPLSASARYGTYAMEILINQLLKLGARRQNLEAKLFGGGNVLSGFTVANVGERNVNFALQYLRNEGIPIVAQDLQDIYPRKVYFWPQDGRVLVKKLKSIHNDTLAQREQEYSKRIRSSTVAGDVELFD
ncbi:chemoreceptor glutamine deamidase CheD [Methylogaea oryzae]|uniref:Probable chemoreceptor glutamine deamidase CheD n=1 Tax=Methylogaea oryzae TaxID=1295382 RepID=A0A8D5AKM0_9GAMM|nr:chemoreceptor glutamine deamidase CheD [Methylogaea oryzae]BBL71281.1 putative chemoreceptor glutamine deamidase CheD 1 [Methylogaea oryzae]